MGNCFLWSDLQVIELNDNNNPFVPGETDSNAVVPQFLYDIQESQVNEGGEQTVDENGNGQFLSVNVWLRRLLCCRGMVVVAKTDVSFSNCPYVCLIAFYGCSCVSRHHVYHAL